MARLAFRTLWTVAVRHGFWGGATDAMGFTVPPATAQALAGVRALARTHDGRLQVLAEVGADDRPRAPLGGMHLVFGLQPRSAAFDTATQPDGIAPGDTRVWSNADDPATLAGPQAMRITGPTPRLTAASPLRPLTLRLRDAAGGPIASQVLRDGEDGWTPRLVLPRGDWQVEEQPEAGPAQRRAFRVDPDLAGAWGMLWLTLPPGPVDPLTDGTLLTLDFAARSDTLRYYVVAQHFDDERFAQLAVVDAGAAADARAPIAFDRIEPAAFGPGHLAPALLDPAGSARIALFQARAGVPRRARGPSGLQLHRNGDVLVGHLPQPGAERHDAQFVVHLSLR